MLKSLQLVPAVILMGVLVVSGFFAGHPDEQYWNPVLAAILASGALISWCLSRSDSERREVCLSRAQQIVIALLWAIPLSTLVFVLREIITRHALPPFSDRIVEYILIFAGYGSALYIGMNSLNVAPKARWTMVAVGAIVATVLAVMGIQEFVQAHKLGDLHHRVFGTSTPDYFAAYEVLWAPFALAAVLTLPARDNSKSSLPALLIVAAALSLVVQVSVILLTSSRFALVSLTIAGVTTSAVILRFEHGLPTSERTSLRRVIPIVAILVAGFIAVGAPVLNRLMHPEANSAEFRIWTWRGTLLMIKAHPILGSGLGTFSGIYPRFALTGFTTVAHDSYLQAAAETGIVSAIALVLALAFAIVSAVRILLTVAPEDQSRNSDYAGVRLGIGLTAAAVGAVVGGSIQNLIDSDLYVSIFGIAFAFIFGVMLASSASLQAPGATVPLSGRTHKWQLVFPFLLLGTIVFGSVLAVASDYDSQGFAQLQVGNITDARSSFKFAFSLDRLNGEYLADSISPRGTLPAPETANADVLALRRATNLDPVPALFRRTSVIAQIAGNSVAAREALLQGLVRDPNSIDLLFDLVHLTAPAQRISLYQRICKIEVSPVGRVRALSLTEVRFAYADSALAAFYTTSDPNKSIQYSKRATSLIQSYIDEGGTAKNIMRQAVPGAGLSPMQDKQLFAIYSQMLTLQEKIAPGDRAALKADGQSYLNKMAALTAN